MTKEEFLALAAARYEAIKDLQRHDNFYDYEKEFEQIMIDLSREVLEKSLGEVPTERRKKKRLQTRFGDIELAHAHGYCQRGRGFRMSPYMQELSVYCGHLDVYQRASEIIAKLLRVETSATTVWRISDHYGRQLQPVLYQPSPPAAVAEPEVIYAELDGSMIFTDQQWREVKLGRVFSSQDIVDGFGSKRGQAIEHSEYTAHLGGHDEFLEKFFPSTDKYAALGERLVFLSDGARWIEQALSQRYPCATQILDFYHVVEYLGAFAQVAISDAETRRRWIAQHKALLLAGRVEQVIDSVARHRGNGSATVKEQRERLLRYYRSNQERMRYDEYIRRGLYIGSGAIESAHRTVVQRRMKLSGQRWTNAGAEHMLNLRACSLSGKWNLLENLIKHPASVPA